MSMNDNQILLVRTPAQHGDESTWGFVLRLSDCNGYKRPSLMFQMLGLGRWGHSGIGFASEKLAMALGSNGSTLRPYASPDGGRVALLGVTDLLPYDLSMNSGQVCPSCIAESGYMPAWMDLRHVDACPFHRCQLLRECSQCGVRLDFDRPALLECRCGARWTAESCQPASEEHCSLTHRMISMFRGDDSGEPIGGLVLSGSSSLARLFGLCVGLASLHASVSKALGLSPTERAARMLENWPRNLFAAVDALSPQSEETVRNGAVRIQRYANFAYRQMMHSVTDLGDIAQLLKTLSEYSPGNADASREQLAIPDRPPTIAPAKARPRPSKKGGPLQARALAARLDVPVSVLRYLRKNGYIQSKKPFGSATGSSFDAIMAFEEKVDKLAASDSNTGRSIGLRKLFARKLKGDGKGIIVAAVLEGRIAIVGREGAKLLDLQVDAEQAEELHRSLTQAARGGTFSCEEVGRLLGLPAQRVAAACRIGILPNYACVAGLRVYADTIEDFRKTYVALSEVAPQASTHPRWVVLAAKDVEVEIFRDELRPKENVFMRRADMPLVIARLHRAQRGLEQLKAGPNGNRKRSEPATSDARTVRGTVRKRQRSPSRAQPTSLPLEK